MLPSNIKKELRKISKNVILDAAYLKNSNDIILNKVKKIILDSNPKTIALYFPIAGEVDVLPLFNFLKEHEIRVVVPKINENDELIFVKFIDNLQKHLNKYKIIEIDGEEISKNDIDIIFIPGLAFSLNKYRLGHGKGYYDRYLFNYKKLKIGLTFEKFLVEEILDASPFDVLMDEIITESRKIA